MASFHLPVKLGTALRGSVVHVSIWYNNLYIVTKGVKTDHNLDMCTRCFSEVTQPLFIPLGAKLGILVLVLDVFMYLTNLYCSTW